MNNTELSNLLYFGNTYTLSEETPIDEESVDRGLKVLIESVKTNPKEILEILLDMYYKNKVTYMTLISLSALLSLCPIDFWNKNRPVIVEILKYLPANNLKIVVKIIKSGSFSVKLGSRIQKAIREVMESWSVEVLEFYLINSCKDLYSLLRIIHPRYKGIKGKMIQNIRA